MAKKSKKRKWDINVAKTNTLRRKVKRLSKRLRYYKIQPAKTLKRFADELRNLVKNEIEKWRIRNGK